VKETEFVKGLAASSNSTEESSKRRMVQFPHQVAKRMIQILDHIYLTLPLIQIPLLI